MLLAIIDRFQNYEKEVDLINSAKRSSAPFFSLRNRKITGEGNGGSNFEKEKRKIFSRKRIGTRGKGRKIFGEGK